MIEHVRIAVSDVDGVSARVYRATGRSQATLILAHGAGAGQSHPFMMSCASGLAARGLDIVTFNFLYIEQGRRRPDPAAVLESTWRAAIEWTRSASELDTARLFLGGKSMGGRIASHVVAAAGPGLGVAGLVFLGYPLHPPGKPDQLRVRHFSKIAVPMLFVQGTRDALGTPDELRPWLAAPQMRAEIVVVEGGDHSLALPKRMGKSQDDTFGRIEDRVVSWMREVE